MQSFSILQMGRGSALNKRLFASFLLYHSTLLPNIAPGKYSVIKVECGLKQQFKIFLNKSAREKRKKYQNAQKFGLQNTFATICNRVLMINYNALTRKTN